MIRGKREGKSVDMSGGLEVRTRKQRDILIHGAKDKKKRKKEIHFNNFNNKKKKQIKLTA